MKKISENYVTKTELEKALDVQAKKIVDEISEVIQAGFSMTASKKELEEVATKKDFQLMYGLNAETDRKLVKLDRNVEAIDEKLEIKLANTDANVVDLQHRVKKLEHKVHFATA